MTAYRNLTATIAMVLTGAALASSAHAAPPAKGEDIAGKTVYVKQGSWLRYSDALISRVYTTTKATLQVKGRGACTKLLCPVTHNGVDVWALLSRLELEKPEGPITTERTLRPGDDGEDVKVMQEALIKKGYKVKADGKFGSGTEDAVRAFQEKSGITVDGDIGKETRDKLKV